VRVSVEHDRAVHLALQGGALCDVGDPKLIGFGRRETARVAVDV
jgi:hypothetical protein